MALSEAQSFVWDGIPNVAAPPLDVISSEEEEEEDQEEAPPCLA